MTDIYICCICGEEHEDKNIHHIEIKGKNKVICEQCATSIKGLV